MGGVLTRKPAKPAPAATDPAPKPAAARPGSLPHPSPDSATPPSQGDTRQTLRDAASARANRLPPDAEETGSAAQDGDGEAGAATSDAAGGASAAPEVTADAAIEDGETAGSGDTGAAEQSDWRARPANLGNPGAGSAYRKNPKPKIPVVKQPDLGAMRSPVVPPPPAIVVEKRLDILKSTGSLPENHHAAVQRAVDQTVDRARAAQRHMTFSTATTAAHTRGKIEAMAREVPGIVGGGVARIKSAAASVIAEIDRITDAQIMAVITHVDVAQTDMEASENNTANTMHEMLMVDAPQVLRDAKAEMDTELAGLADAAGIKIAAIKGGQKPDPIPNEVPPDTQAPKEPEEPPDPATIPPEPPTWDQAEAEIAGQLGTGIPDARLTQYANLRCAGALPGLVDPLQDDYDLANAETITGLTSDDTKRRFFDQTMGLIVPAVSAEENHADRVSDDAYIGSFGVVMGLVYTNLSSDKQAIVRQLDEKRVVLTTETLNPDYKDSLPAMAIKGLREAGEKIETGLMDQARVIEASLKANVASLAAEYPAVVARLLPIINTGGFLEATATLAQIVEARRSIGILEDGQIAQVAQQAGLAVKQARDGFDQQAKALRKTADTSVRNLHEYGARAHYDLVRTTASYTGVIDDGVRDTLPQILDHAERTATRLLGPKEDSKQGFSNIKTAAVNFINGVVAGEWQSYVARLNGMEEQLGGVEAGPLARGIEQGTPFGQIRHGVVADSIDRANRVETAMTPAPLNMTDDPAQIVGGAVLSPGTLIAYQIYADPNENEIVQALSVPWPGPEGIEEAQVRLRDGHTSLKTLIEERLTTETEQADILNLFSSDLDTRTQAKNNLIHGSDDLFGGVSGETAMAISQSYSHDELNSVVMTEAERTRLGEALASSLSSADDREIAAAYLNGEPDQALAIRMRVLFDRQRGREYNNQLRTGAELDRLIREELFAGSSHAYVPQAEMDRMRDAAFLRFDEISREGRTRVTVQTDRPDVQSIDGGGFAPTQIRTEGRQQAISLPPAETVGYDSRGTASPTDTATAPPQTPPETSTPDIPEPPQPDTSAMSSLDEPQLSIDPSQQEPQSADEAMSREPDIDAARRAVIAYMNRPTHTYRSGRGSTHRQADLDRFEQMDSRHQQRVYDPETGQVTVSPASTIQAYNTALITHGSSAPETRGALAAASIAYIPRNREPSENQINLMNENFSDSAFNAMRVEWENASPRQRLKMRDRWEKAQEDHALFLRTTAQGMGLEGAALDDPEQVEAFVTDALGDRFAQVDSDHRRAGREIVERGRIGIDTGMALAADGWGTNEQLMQNVMADRSDHEWNDTREGSTRSMRSIAYSIADDELSGDDWQQAREKLRTPDSDDFERAETAVWLIDQQIEGGSGWLSDMTMDGSWQRADLQQRRQDVDDRLLTGMQAGIEDARRRGLDVSGFPSLTSPRLPNGQLHPLVRRFAMDGDGNLRGDGPNMAALVSDTRQSADYYRAEIDRQEGMFTSIITALAIVASVVALLIPGVNAVAAGILIALVSGAATVAVKAGMRGNRYGMEEAAVDIGSAAIEAATAGVGGALSKGAGLAATRAAATTAKEAAKATAAIAKLGRVGRAGVSLHGRLGPTGAALVSEVATGTVSATANAAMNDEMWNDGMGTGLARLAGHGLQGGAASAINVGISSKVTGSLDARLAPNVGDRATLGKLNRIGRSLGPEGREMLTEVTAGLAGSLSAEGVGILADLARDPDKMTMKVALERLGKSGLQELFSTGGRTAVQQRHRRRVNIMSADVMSSGRAPTPAEALLLNKLSQSAGLTPHGTPTSEYIAQFGVARARIAQMPDAIRPHLMQMSPAKALEVVAMLDAGQLGTRKQRIAFTNALGKEIHGLNVQVFDRLLVKANADHAPERRARKARIKDTRKAVLRGVRGPERAMLGDLPLDGIADLTPAQHRDIAQSLTEGAPPLAGILHDAIPDNPGLRSRAMEQLTDAATAIGDARANIARQRERISDDLTAAAPAALRQTLADLKPRDADALHNHMLAGDAAAAAAILGMAGLLKDAASAHATRMTGRMVEQRVRRDYMDNVAPEHHDAMAQLTPDALMEIRVAQFTRAPLDEDRISALLADAKSRRPGLDQTALRAAMTATMQTPHGRPGFRTALAQKRALLDLVPFGMKGEVLRTPMITLPDDAFLTFVRGSGSENAVTLIVNGKPVVLMREGADPRKLAEEGLHVLQYHDPAFRTRLAGLDEGRIARWDDLSLEAKLGAYREKVDIEIDAQQRMIARLEKRIQNAWLPGTRALALKQLEQTLAAHDHLTARRSEVDGLTAQDMADINAGLRDSPDWLDQPARLFSKGHEDDDLMREFLPHEEKEIGRMLPVARPRVRAAYYDLTRRIKNLSRDDRKRLLNLLRTMKGAVDIDTLVDAVNNTNKPDADPAFAHLQNLGPGQLVDALQNHLFDSMSPGALSDRQDALISALRAKIFSDSSKSKDARLRALFTKTVKELTNHAGDGTGEPHELTMAKKAMFLSLETQIANRASNATLEQQLELVASVLGVGTRADAMPELRGKPAVQAFIIEALATNKSMLLAKNKPEASVADYVTAVRKIVADGITDYPIEAQRNMFEALSRAYYTKADGETLRALSALPGAIAARLGEDGSRQAARTVLNRALLLLSQQPSGRYKQAVLKILPILAFDVDFRLAALEVDGRAPDRLTVRDINDYIRRAIGDDKFFKSLMRAGGRARDKAAAAPEMMGPFLRDSDRQRIVEQRTLATGQDSFTERHADPLTGTGRGLDIETSREDVAARVVGAAENHGLTLSPQEARAIAKRIETLDLTALFGPLAGRDSTRDALQSAFLAELAATKLPANADKRGEAIEKAFRQFSRELGAEGGAELPGGRDIPLLRAIQDGGDLPGPDGPISLSPAARVEMMMIMVRGERPAEMARLPTGARDQIALVRKALMDQYMAQQGSDLAPAAAAKLRAEMERMFSEGFLHVEQSAKGSVFEHMIEGLMSMDMATDKSKPFPARFDEVTSATKDAELEFRSVDQTTDKTPRSLDNAVQIDKEKDLPPGMETGEVWGIDAKNGPTAFNPDQFKRYLIEMLKGAKGEASIFGPEGLAGLIYMADNPANAKHAHASVMAIMDDILKPASGDTLTVTIKDQAGVNQTFDISAADLRDHASKLKVLFGRVGQTSSAASTAANPIGPFMIEDYDGSVAGKIAAALGPSQLPQTPENED